MFLFSMHCHWFTCPVALLIVFSYVGVFWSALARPMDSNMLPITPPLRPTLPNRHSSSGSTSSSSSVSSITSDTLSQGSPVARSIEVLTSTGYLFCNDSEGVSRATAPLRIQHRWLYTFTGTNRLSQLVGTPQIDQIYYIVHPSQHGPRREKHLSPEQLADYHYVMAVPYEQIRDVLQRCILYYREAGGAGDLIRADMAMMPALRHRASQPRLVQHHR